MYDFKLLFFSTSLREQTWYFWPNKGPRYTKQKKRRQRFMFGKALSDALYRNWAHSQLHIEQSPYFHWAHGFFTLHIKVTWKFKQWSPATLHFNLLTKRVIWDIRGFRGFCWLTPAGHTVFDSHRRSITSPSLIDDGVRASQVLQLCGATFPISGTPMNCGHFSRSLRGPWMLFFSAFGETKSGS